MSGLLLIIVGPSGTGKGTTLAILRDRHPEWIFPISATTRKPRPNERNGIDYYFLSHAEFEAKIEAGEFLEWATVHRGEKYGLLKSSVIPCLETGKTVVREIDIQGFEALQQILPQSLVSIFLLPPSEATLIARIKQRAPISDEELHLRLESMRMEIERGKACDYQIQTVDDNRDIPANEIEKIVEKHQQVILRKR